ncbi:MAG: site-2 protease family protein [Deltaproteobacteria bacterium]|nr:site-2 protease family protein [Deltaproteobacteria bacterium]MCL5791545.1 site-2 protease family protein [Deltaproteobacteria bacterium]
MDTASLKEFILLIPVILFSLMIHEICHGLVADKLGDPTARLTGRLTFNPLAHLDPIGTLMLFIAHFGWAKPVMVNPYNLRNPKKDMIWISLAGPGANFSLAIMAGIIIRFTLNYSLNSMNNVVVSSLFVMLILFLQINLALGIFNLIPIPPLDGSKVLFGLLPTESEHKFYWLEKYGMVILLILFVLDSFTPIKILSIILWLPANMLSYLFSGYSLFHLLGVLNLLLG